MKENRTDTDEYAVLWHQAPLVVQLGCVQHFAWLVAVVGVRSVSEGSKPHSSSLRLSPSASRPSLCAAATCGFYTQNHGFHTQNSGFHAQNHEFHTKNAPQNQAVRKQRCTTIPLCV